MPLTHQARIIGYIRTISTDIECIVSGVHLVVTATAIFGCQFKLVAGPCYRNPDLPEASRVLSRTNHLKPAWIGPKPGNIPASNTADPRTGNGKIL